MGKFIGLVGAVTTVGAVAYLMAPLPQSADVRFGAFDVRDKGCGGTQGDPGNLSRQITHQSHAPHPTPSGEPTVVLVQQIQAELHRLGCYGGAIDGKWNDATQRAMQTLGERVSVLRPVDTPDYIMLALARSQASAVCGRRRSGRRPRSRATRWAAIAAPEIAGPGKGEVRPTNGTTRHAAAEPGSSFGIGAAEGLARRPRCAAETLNRPRRRVRTSRRRAEGRPRRTHAHRDAQACRDGGERRAARRPSPRRWTRPAAASTPGAGYHADGSWCRRPAIRCWRISIRAIPTRQRSCARLPQPLPRVASQPGDRPAGNRDGATVGDIPTPPPGARRRPSASCEPALSASEVQEAGEARMDAQRLHQYAVQRAVILPTAAVRATPKSGPRYGFVQSSAAISLFAKATRSESTRTMNCRKSAPSSGSCGEKLRIAFPREHEHHRRAVGDHGCGARHATEEAHFADHRLPDHAADTDRPARVVDNGDGNRALRDEVDGIGGTALRAQQLASLVFATFEIIAQ